MTTRADYRHHYALHFQALAANPELLKLLLSFEGAVVLASGGDALERMEKWALGSTERVTREEDRLFGSSELTNEQLRRDQLALQARVVDLEGQLKAKSEALAISEQDWRTSERTLIEYERVHGLGFDGLEPALWARWPGEAEEPAMPRPPEDAENHERWGAILGRVTDLMAHAVKRAEQFEALLAERDAVVHAADEAREHYEQKIEVRARAVRQLERDKAALQAELEKMRAEVFAHEDRQALATAERHATATFMGAPSPLGALNIDSEPPTTAEFANDPTTLPELL